MVFSFITESGRLFIPQIRHNPFFSQSGDDPKTVKKNLGHHSAAFTPDAYGHVTDRMKRESAKRMERFIHSTIAR